MAWSNVRVIGVSATVGMALALSLPVGAQTPSRPATVPASGPATVPALRFKFGPDTTRIDKPLLPDGRPDYIAAINEHYSKGVTKENNAAIVLLEVFGPELLHEKVRDKILKMLDMGAPVGPFLVLAKDWPGEQLDRAYHKIWEAQEYPELAQWLKDNAALLDKLVSATRRTRFYLPLATPADGHGGLDVDIPKLIPVRRGARALVARGHLAAGEGRSDDAVGDLLAAYRLGMLVGQGETLVERMVSVAVTSLSVNAMRELAVSGKLSARQAAALISAMRDLGPMPVVVEAMDIGERYTFLGTFTWFGADPTAFLQMYGKSDGGANSASEKIDKEITRAARVADWNVVLRRFNQLFDEQVAAWKLPTFAQRAEAIARLDKDALAAAGRWDETVLKGIPPGDESRVLAEFMASRFGPWLGRAQILADKVQIERNLTDVTLALAAYKAEKGSYPEKLEVLVPAYLKVIPNDANEKPFTYRATKDGFLLYSVGENLKDDGGKTPKDDKGADDIVVKAPPEGP